MKPDRALINQISREIANRPVTHGLPDIQLPVSATTCTSPQEMLDSIRRQNQRIEQSEKARLARQLGRENIFRFGYVPMVISELAWDYAETVTSMAQTMRIASTRSLCRAVTKLRAEYLEIHDAYLDNKHLDGEVENMLIFEKAVSDIFHTFIINLRCDLIREHPDLSQESILYLTAIYQCHVVLLALFRYADRQASKVEHMIGRPVHDIVPSPVRRLADLIIEFVGDSPVSDSFLRLQRTYVETLATQIALVDLTSNLNKQ